MIYIVIKDENRELTLRSINKIMKMYPDEEITLTDEPLTYVRRTYKIVRYLVTRGRTVWVESDGMTHNYGIHKCAEFGANLIFTWYGFRDNSVTDFFPMYHAEETVKKYPVKVKVRVPIVPENEERIEMTIEGILTLQKEFPTIDFELDYQRPKIWLGARRALEKARAYMKIRGQIKLGRDCGGITITPNTNIYPCPLLPRRKRKQFFGNAARDKNCIGTLRRGFFREIPKCKFCEAVKYGNN